MMVQRASSWLRVSGVECASVQDAAATGLRGRARDGDATATGGRWRRRSAATVQGRWKEHGCARALALVMPAERVIPRVRSTLPSASTCVRRDWQRRARTCGTALTRSCVASSPEQQWRTCGYRHATAARQEVLSGVAAWVLWGHLGSAGACRARGRTDKGRRHVVRRYEPASPAAVAA
jgi:hypothetical protein